MGAFDVETSEAMKKLILWQMISFNFIFIQSTSGETCRNYETFLLPSRFREGYWHDQLRVFSGEGKFVSPYHPNETVSLFLAKFFTNCGYFELKIQSEVNFQMYKGFPVPRFNDHFMPFFVNVIQTRTGTECRIHLERNHCEMYKTLNETIARLNILETDYRSYMFIHQCIHERNYIMLLTRKQRLLYRERVGIQEYVVHQLMKKYEIDIENSTFWWPVQDFCHKYIYELYPLFYRRMVFDRNQTECPNNIRIQLADLKMYWLNKTETDYDYQQFRKRNMIGTVSLIVGFVTIVGLWMFLNDNYHL